MTNEIVFTCKSTNNKNVRGNELKILRKVGRNLYFEFGENENNIKKRYYTDIETLNSDFEKLEKLKQKLEKEELEEETETNEPIEDERAENELSKAKKSFNNKNLF